MTSSHPGAADLVERHIQLVETSLARNVKTTCQRMLDQRSPQPVDTILFSKGLPHDKHGNVDPKEHQKMVRACREGDMKLLGEVKMGGELKLHSPSSMGTVDMFGPLAPQFYLPPPPKVTSDTVGAEMVELYWRSLTRDIPYAKWHASQRIANAIRDLNACGKAYQGPKPVTLQNIFRGPGAGVDIGPFVSQLALRPYTIGGAPVSHQIQPYAEGRNYMQDVKTYLSAQSGKVLEQAVPSEIQPRYWLTPRDGLASVHTDSAVQWGHTAVYILAGLKCPFNRLNPFYVDASTPVKNQLNFIDMGIMDCMDLVCRATRLALLTIWWYKWSFFRLRPENTGYLVHLNMTDQRDRLHECPKLSPVILKSNVLKYVYKQQGNYLLSQGYPEGCPPHPSYGCGHCIFAVASLTIVKAFFEGSFLLDAMVPSADGCCLQAVEPKLQLRVDDELNKLINNVALSRDTSGVHYFSDSLATIPLGEQIADHLLRECAHRYKYATGFTYKTYSGKWRTITNFDSERTPLCKPLSINRSTNPDSEDELP